MGRITMTLPAFRLILADIAHILPETIHADSTWDAIFGKDWLDDGVWPPQVVIAQKIERETGRTIPWAEAMKWRTVQDVLDFLEAREEKPFGDPPD